MDGIPLKTKFRFWYKLNVQRITWRFISIMIFRINRYILNVNFVCLILSNYGYPVRENQSTENIWDINLNYYTIFFCIKFSIIVFKVWWFISPL